MAIEAGFDAASNGGDTRNGAEPDPVFYTGREIMAALRRAKHYFDPRTNSIIVCRDAGGSRNQDPFRPGFISGLEERVVLARLLRMLDPRSRMLLLLWYVESVPVTRIAHRLKMSRVHAYRVRDKALKRMVRQCKIDAARAASASGPRGTYRASATYGTSHA